jgi:predicted aspartyl protease
VFEGEDAGGYNFRFEPPGMPSVDLVLYSDPEEQQYLQIMSSEIALAETDPTSIRHRSFYYYEFDDNGRILTSRETGREIDNEGETVNFMDFIVTGHTLIGERPAELAVDTSRKPIGTASETLPEPVAIPVDVDNGYFLVPMNFAGSDETFLFLFDTGATAGLFSPAAAEAAGLTSDLAVTGHGHGSRSNFELGLCTTASIGEAGAADQAPLAGFPATRISEENTAVLDALEWYGAAGILGISPLYQYVVGFDHMNKQIICYPPSLFDKDANLDKPNLELWLDVEDLVYAQGRLSDQIEGEVIIDTGLQQDLAILRETAEANGLNLEKIDERNSTVLGGVRSFDYVKVPSFELGPLRMENKVASLTDDDRGSLSARGLLGFVGITMFFGVRVTIDLFDQRMYIEDPLGSGLFEGLLPGEDAPVDEAAPEEGEGEDLEVMLSRAGAPAPSS